MESQIKKSDSIIKLVPTQQKISSEFPKADTASQIGNTIRSLADTSVIPRADSTSSLADSTGNLTTATDAFQDSLNVEPTYEVTLEQAIDSALRRNIDIRQVSLQSEASRVLLNQASSNMLPSIFSNVNKGINFGRNVDPFTNTFATENIKYGVYGLSSTAVLFNGFNLRNTRRQNQFAYEASRTDLQGIKQETILNVILSYFRLLNVEEQLQVAKENLEISKRQVSRLRLMESQGVVAPSLVTDILGAMHKDELLITNLSNQIELFKLQLAQQMNIPYREGLSVSKIELEDSISVSTLTPSVVHQVALESFPEIKSAELQTKSAEYALKAAKGLRFPTITLGTNIQTLYTSSARNTSSGKIPFSEQFSNNRYTAVNVGIRIPIFMANTIRNQIKLASINLENSTLVEERVKVAVHREIEQAYLEMMNAYKRYKTISDQLNAYRQSFRAAEARFTIGVDSSFDYMMAKDNLDQANINFINAKYEFLLRKKILEYYQNIDL